MNLKRILSATVIMVIVTLLFGGLGSANVIVVNSEKAYPVSVLVDNGSPIIQATGVSGFAVFKLAKNGTVEWAVSGKDLIPVNADLLSGPFYSPEGFGSAISKAPDGGVLLGFTVLGENATFYPALMKISSNGSFEWAYIYKLGINMSPWIDSVYAWDNGILLSGRIENDTPYETKYMPLLMLLKPNGTVVWARVYHPPLLTKGAAGGALEVNGSHVYILQGQDPATPSSTLTIILRLDRNGNVTKVNSVSGVESVNSAASDGRYLYLLGADENGTVLVKFDLGGDNLIWAKEYSIEFNDTKVSCSPNETNMTMVSSKAVPHSFKQLLHVGNGLEVFPMPFELGLPLEGVPCNESIFKQEAALKPVKAIFKVDDNGNLLSKKILVLNSTYSSESFDYSDGTFAFGMTKSTGTLPGAVEPKPLVLVGHFNDLFNLNIAKEVDLNITVRDTSVHLGDVHFAVAYPLSEELNVSSISVEPVNIRKNVPKDVEIKVYKTKTISTEKSTTTRKITKEMCGPASLVALAILPALLFFRRR